MNWYAQGHNLRQRHFLQYFFVWQKMAIFSQNGHFLPLNGRQDRQDFAQSCPRGWQRLTRKISNCGTKLTNVVLKVWDNIWDCGGYTPPNTHFAEVICRGNHQKSPKIIKTTKGPRKPPAIPTNQLTCTTNMIFSHGYRVWKGENVKFNFALYLRNIHFSW